MPFPNTPGPTWRFSDVYQKWLEAQTIFKNLEKCGHQQAALTLQERMTQCSAALTLRSKPLRNIPEDEKETLVLSLKDFWGDFSWEVQIKLIDARSDGFQLQLSKLESSQVEERKKSMKGCLLKIQFHKYFPTLFSLLSNYYYYKLLLQLQIVDCIFCKFKIYTNSEYVHFLMAVI